MDFNLNKLSENLTNITNPLTEGPSITTFATILPSFTGLQGWLTLFLIYCVFETCRKVAFQAWGTVLASFWITIDLTQGNRSYDWMMLWLSQHPRLEKAGRFSISDSAPGIRIAAGEGRKAHFLLALDHVYTLWHKGRFIRAYRKETKRRPSPTAAHSLHISILGGGRQTANDLLTEAMEYWKEVNEARVSVYASNRESRWNLISSHPKRLLESVILDSGIKEDILDDAQEFLSSKKWYLQRGIPFRRGYLLVSYIYVLVHFQPLLTLLPDGSSGGSKYGAPGSGKTSLIQGIAGELSLDVYILSLSRMGLTDNGLRELTTTLPERCIALMEDIDVAFRRTANRDCPSGKGQPEETKGPEPPKEGVSLSGLLNALDGVGAQEGRILFATTNRFQTLDPALRRPGRIDYLVEFKLASQYQVGELFKRFYLPIPRASTSQLSLYKDSMTSKDDDRNRKTSNPAPRTQVEPETEKLIDVEPTGAQDQPLAAGVHRSRRDFEVSPEELDVLVERFREAIPEREFSMAALQGYLLMHKDQPQRAVECARKWVEEEMAKRESC